MSGYAAFLKPSHILYDMKTYYVEGNFFPKILTKAHDLILKENKTNLKKRLKHNKGTSDNFIQATGLTHSSAFSFYFDWLV